MQFVAHTGASCPVDVKRAMIEWWGPIFMDAYGASEVGTTCSISSEEWLAHPGSVGRSLPPFEALILDDDDQPVPAGTEGRLFFRDTTGRGVVYPNDAAKTAAAHIAPGVFTLGEIGYLDARRLRVHHRPVLGHGRVGWSRTSTRPRPSRCCSSTPPWPTWRASACPTPRWARSSRPGHPGRPADPPDPKGLVAWCRERLSHYKCPRSIELVDDLGRNTMGKINKRKLRAPYWEGPGHEAWGRSPGARSLASGGHAMSEPVLLVDDPARQGAPADAEPAGQAQRPQRRPARRAVRRAARRRSRPRRLGDRDPRRRPGFCAGYDLGGPNHDVERAIAKVDGWWSRHVVNNWFEMWDMATPIIGQVHGYCLAGGTELATACDLVYVAEDAKIGYPPVRLMSPPDMQWQTWMMGLRRGMEALLTGDSMSGTRPPSGGSPTGPTPLTSWRAPCWRSPSASPTSRSTCWR